MALMWANRKIGPVHSTFEDLTNIFSVYLSLNTTSVLQSRYQWAIRSLKAHYQKGAVRQLTRALDQNFCLPKVSMLTAMNILSCQNAISTESIVNCFRMQTSVVQVKVWSKLMAMIFLKNYGRSSHVYCPSTSLFV